MAGFVLQESSATFMTAEEKLEDSNLPDYIETHFPSDLLSHTISICMPEAAPEYSSGPASPSSPR